MRSGWAESQEEIDSPPSASHRATDGCLPLLPSGAFGSLPADFTTSLRHADHAAGSTNWPASSAPSGQLSSRFAADGATALLYRGPGGASRPLRPSTAVG